MIPIVGNAVFAILGNKPERRALVRRRRGTRVPQADRRRPGLRLDDERAVVLCEILAYRIGLIDDADLDQVIGKPLRLEIRGPEAEPGFDVSLADRSKGGGRDEQSPSTSSPGSSPGPSTSSA